MKHSRRLLALLLRATLLALAAAPGWAQQLDTRFSCSATQDEDGEQVTYSDTGEAHLDGDRIKSFRWESALFRPTHGFDCSIDDSDGLQAELMQGIGSDAWRIGLQDARATRERRGYNFDRGLNCSIRLEREGATLNVTPSCPALCGSRANFTQLSVDLNTGKCHYVE